MFIYVYIYIYRGSFKIKMLKKIVQSAYCQIYVREEIQVVKLSDLYVHIFKFMIIYMYFYIMF
jgi:hypothetical protein